MAGGIEKIIADEQNPGDAFTELVKLWRLL